ncbi:hypothetical protein [Nocardioides sp.]|uniref:hypothetical protein n=1 Tax=Nocardioides sp. TaxID=35761 RepID=UPI0035AF2043
MYDDYSLFGPPPTLLAGDGRVSHLVFLDGRLVDAWTESHHDTRWAGLARELDAERRPQVVHSPPPPPRHAQVLAWLDGIVGGREALVALAPDPRVPLLRDVLDPVADEPWLVVDELAGDVCDALLTPDLEAPLRRCLLLLRDRAPWLAERTAPDRIAAGVVWLVGKANAAIGPAGPVTQGTVATHLGVSSLTPHGNAVAGHLRRVGWTAPRPWPRDHPDLYATGRPELLSAGVVADLVLMRDEALAEQVRLDEVS